MITQEEKDKRQRAYNKLVEGVDVPPEIQSIADKYITGEISTSQMRRMAVMHSVRYRENRKKGLDNPQAK